MSADMIEAKLSSEELNPGSFRDFSESTGLSGQEAIDGYSDALNRHRLARAAELGIDLEDLHRYKFPRVEKSR